MNNYSIVIISNDHNTILRETLPELLSQQYDAEYEVIVVRETRRGDIKDLLETLYENYPRLRSTYLPDKPQYVTNEEVEILLGVKAAKYPDIIMVAPDFMPYGETWLNECAAAIEEEGLTTERPLILADAHTHDASFFHRRSHANELKRVLKPWCKLKGIKSKTLRLPKDQRQLFSIAFRREDYINDMPLRDVIYRQMRNP